VGWEIISSLSSIFDPPDNSGGPATPWMLGSLFQLASTLLSALSTSNELPRSDPENEVKTDKEKGKTLINLAQNLHRRKMKSLGISFERQWHPLEGLTPTFDQQMKLVLHFSHIRYHASSLGLYSVISDVSF
jgi:hypothetical protein